MTDWRTLDDKQLLAALVDRNVPTGQATLWVEFRTLPDTRALIRSVLTAATVVPLTPEWDEDYDEDWDNR